MRLPNLFYSFDIGSVFSILMESDSGAFKKGLT